jgi:hypothetical protein
LTTRLDPIIVCSSIAYEKGMKDADDVHCVHQLVLVHGRERAKELVTPKARSLVDIAAEVMADDTQRIGISYTGFCLIPEL